MGKPAARLTDNTAHGGLIMGPGCPTVLIGKMPAATLGDMHVCPMMTPAVPPIPHVGGPILLGSMGVFIGKKPAARLGDMCMCVGPPSTVIMGCMTVLIGEAGSGSQAGAAGAAAAAQASKMKGPKALEPFPAEEPGKSGEMHFIQTEFADAGGKVFQGAPYQLTDPDKKEPVGASSSEGGLYHDGYAKAGKFEVKVPALSEVKWSKDKMMIGDDITLTAKADGFEDGVKGSISLYEQSAAGRQRVFESLPIEVKGGKIEQKWKVDLSGLSPDTIPEAGLALGPKEFRFQVFVHYLQAVSSPAKIEAHLKISPVDVLGRPLKGRKVKATFEDGTSQEKTVDDKGLVDFGVVPAGAVRIHVIEPEQPLPDDGESGPYLETKTVLRRGCRDEEGVKRLKKAGKIEIKGAQVFDLQKDLVELGFTEVGNPDGDYGEKTKLAVKAFQEAAKGKARKQKDKDVEVEPGFKGVANGVVDGGTKAEIKGWKGEEYGKCEISGTIILQKAQEIALKVSSAFEGKGYVNLAGNFDGQGISFGIIQWNFGQNTLAPLLKKFHSEDSAGFAACFGANSKDYLDFLKLLDKPSRDQVDWANGIQEKKTKKNSKGKLLTVFEIQNPWGDYLLKLAEYEKFQSVQKVEAISEYHKKVDGVVKWLRSIKTDPFKKVSLRGYCALFDLCVQQGGLRDSEKKSIQADLDKVSTVESAPLIKKVVDIKGSSAAGENGKFRADCVSRRFGILEAKPVKVERKDRSGNVIVASRSNENFSLLTTDKWVSGF